MTNDDDYEGDSESEVFNRERSRDNSLRTRSGRSRGFLSFQNIANTSSTVVQIIDRYIITRRSTDDEPSAFQKAKEGFLEVLYTITPQNEQAQIVFGGLSGWFTGLLLMRIGKFAAFIFGAGLLTLQVVHYFGYIRIEWAKIHRDLSGRGRQYFRRNTVVPELNRLSCDEFVEQYKHVCLGFIGGFFLGVAMG